MKVNIFACWLVGVWLSFERKAVFQCQEIQSKNIIVDYEVIITPRTP